MRITENVNIEDKLDERGELEFDIEPSGFDCSAFFSIDKDEAISLINHLNNAFSIDTTKNQ